MATPRCTATYSFAVTCQLEILKFQTCDTLYQHSPLFLFFFGFISLAFLAACFYHNNKITIIINYNQLHSFLLSLFLIDFIISFSTQNIIYIVFHKMLDFRSKTICQLVATIYPCNRLNFPFLQ